MWSSYVSEYRIESSHRNSKSPYTALDHIDIVIYIYICELIDSDCDCDCHCILILILKQEDANDADDADDTVSIGKTGLMWSLASKS